MCLTDAATVVSQGIAPSKLVNAVVDTINYADHLRKTQPDCDSRWDNVQELVNFASEVERSAPDDVARRMNKADDDLHKEKGDESEEESEDEWADEVDEFDGGQVQLGQARAARGYVRTYWSLRRGLQPNMLPVIRRCDCSCKHQCCPQIRRHQRKRRARR